jgi:rhodanese-related sulfurtransferase
MIQALKNMLGFGPKVNYRELILNGAIIVDVRTKSEFLSGHVNSAINIPLNTLSENLKKFKNKNQTIITCCASGMRSASAKNYLIAQGYTNVYNGGSWYSLQKYEK